MNVTRELVSGLTDPTPRSPRLSLTDCGTGMEPGKVKRRIRTTISPVRESMPFRTVPCMPLPMTSITIYWLTIFRPLRSCVLRIACLFVTTSV